MLFIVYAQILTDLLAVDKNFVYSMLNLLHALDFCLNWITKTCQTTNQDPQYEMNVLILFFSVSHLDGAVQQMHSQTSKIYKRQLSTHTPVIIRFTGACVE